jgi:hypothetical protein
MSPVGEGLVEQPLPGGLHRRDAHPSRAAVTAIAIAIAIAPSIREMVDPW